MVGDHHSSKKKIETITLRVVDCYINSAPSVRYVGVPIDTRLLFDRYLCLAGEKVAHIIGALSWIMPNIAGPRHNSEDF